MKRTLVVSDLHCGHLCGLTPPDWQVRAGGTGLELARRKKYAALEREAWDWYTTALDQYKPFDLVVCNGDAIDGRGTKSGGTELLEPDMNGQCSIAIFCLKQAITKGRTQLRMTYGTPYHTGGAENWEDQIARELDAREIGSQVFFESEGVVFGFKHKVGSSSILHGRTTAISREMHWAIAMKEFGKIEKVPDVLVRSHVHYHAYAGTPNWVAMSTPALQTMGTKFGDRECSGIVDFGFVVFETENGEFEWNAETAVLKSERAEIGTFD